MQSAPLRHLQQQQNEFPFTPSPSPSPTRAPISRAQSSFAQKQGVSGDKLLAIFKGDQEMAKRHEADQKAYGDKREQLITALDETTGLVKGLAAFNQNKWTVHYPHSLGVNTAEQPNPSRSASSPPHTPLRSAFKDQRQSALRRSATMYGEEEVSWTDSSRPSPVRSMTTVPEATAVNEKDPAAAPATPAHPLSILSLDLRQGHGSAAATASLPALLPSLTLQTLSQLLSRRLTASLSHISSLRTRVNDHSSRILVTGDLNAGKSTFVNALLRREVMPWDQQPCTSVFTEVIDADVNGGKEELHAIRDVKKYDRDDEATFDRYSLEEIYDVQENAGDAYYIVKAYVKDNRAPLSEDATNHSLLQNDLVDISLIDGPGLNSDNKSTTALFARQPEIDVVVFVVSAENHFTLSAQEFLKEARQEKAHVFIVVNKWQGIRDKARCMRMVGEQIKELSPTTWELRKELVHFVDAAEYVDPEGKAATEERGDDPSAFDHLEQSLRAFVCLNRTKSKLAPAKHYLLNLLADLSTLASTNLTAANDELSTALLSLERIRPIHDRLAAQRDEVEDGVDRVEESVVEAVKAAAWSRLERALQYVSNGEVVPPSAEPSSADADRPFFEIPDSFEGPSELPPYPGVWGIWEWAGDVKKVLVRALEAEVRAAEDEARVETAEGVHRVVNELGNKYLPEDAASPIVEQQQSTEDATEPTTAAAVPRAFRPEVMFAKRRRGVGRLAARGLSPGLGLGAAGQGVGWSATDFEVSFLDLFDLERIAGHSSAFGLGGGKQKRVKSVEEEVVETGTIVGLGLGSLGMVGSRVIGIKGTMQSLGRIVDVLGSPSARKWAGPALGVITVGLVVYVIVDLPRAIPRNIGRKLALSLSSSSPSSSLSSSGPSQIITFPLAHSDRIAKETRKVLRLAGWDLRERFRAALEKAASERMEVEGVVKRAEAALKFLEEFEEKCGREEETVRAVEV